MKTVHKALISIAVIMLAARIGGLVILVEICIVSPLEPLRFGLRNCDEEEHNVTVEIIDFNGNSIFDESYTLTSEEDVEFGPT